MNELDNKPAEPYEGPDPFCFVSYAHKDQSVVYPVMRTLCDAGVRIWYDKGLNLGDPYHEIILEQIEKCSCFIVFFSETAVDTKRSEFITNEVGQARKYNKPILPVYLNKLIDLPAKLIFNGVADLHSHILECGNPDSISTVLSELLENIPADCRTSCYNRIPYDEEHIDTTLRRYPVILINDTAAQDAEKDLMEEMNVCLKTMISDLSASETVRESIDLAVITPGNAGPVLNCDITPLSLFSCPAVSCSCSNSAGAALTLAGEMLNNCVSFYADIGVSSGQPVVVLFSDFTADSSAYGVLSDNASAVFPAVITVPTGGAAVPPCLAESEAAPQAASLSDAFSAVTDSLFARLGLPRPKAPVRLPDGEPEVPAFRQRRLSQVLKGE